MVGWLAFDMHAYGFHCWSVVNSNRQQTTDNICFSITECLKSLKSRLLSLRLESNLRLKPVIMDVSLLLPVKGKIDEGGIGRELRARPIGGGMGGMAPHFFIAPPPPLSYKTNGSPPPPPPTYLEFTSSAYAPEYFCDHMCWHHVDCTLKLGIPPPKLSPPALNCGYYPARASKG